MEYFETLRDLTIAFNPGGSRKVQFYFNGQPKPGFASYLLAIGNDTFHLTDRHYSQLAVIPAWAQEFLKAANEKGEWPGPWPEFIPNGTIQVPFKDNPQPDLKRLAAEMAGSLSRIEILSQDRKY